MVKRLMVICGVIAAVSFTVTTSASAQAATSTIYRLNQQSTYQEGCVPPCTCPISQRVEVIGTFISTPAPGTVMATYEITEVNWTFIFGNQQIQVTGSGTYEIGGGQQRLQLTLTIGDQSPVPYDSGLVPAKSPFPNIVVAISSISGCFKKVFRVNASPVSQAEIHPYQILSGSTFQRGCFPPCQCTLGPKQPISGDFALIDLPLNPLFQEFAVVNINWQAAPPPALVPIHGVGFYKIGGEVAVEQQMSLELAVDDEPLADFDSGLAQTDVRFPLIDVTVSIPGGQCDNTVIVMKAAPVTAATK